VAEIVAVPLVVEVKVTLHVAVPTVVLAARVHGLPVNVAPDAIPV